MRWTEGATIGQWALVAPLGAGGNAEVWRASNGREEVALKILNQRRLDSEPYRRFRQEIEVLKQIGSRPNVVPLLYSNLPAKPSKTNPAWLAMPIAEPLASALSQSGLRGVVSAVAELAETLADLHEDLDIHHRDLKPSNLYILDGHPAISDFGLVDLPKAADLTLSDRPLGPQYFIAYEMVVNSAHADPAPADVFSLAKTLWVLCVDQRWPPQGEQRASSDAYSIGGFRSHALASQLDELIERCTQHTPMARPSMRQVADDLNAWLRLDSTTPQQPVDLSDIWGKLREVAEPKLREVREDKEQRKCFLRAVRRIRELMKPLNDDIREQFPAAEFNRSSRRIEAKFPIRYSPDLRNVRATILSGPGNRPMRLVIGSSVQITNDGDVEFCGTYSLGTDRIDGSIRQWVSDYKPVPCESLSLEEGLVSLTSEMRALFPEWLKDFMAALESSGT